MINISIDFSTFIFFVLAFVFTTVGTIFIRILGKDAETFLPRLAERIVEYAASMLPKEIREEHREDWLAGLNDTPEILAKLYFSLSIMCLGVRGTRREFQRLKQQSKKDIELVDGDSTTGDSNSDESDQIPALEARRRYIQSWFKQANANEIRSLGPQKSAEVENIDAKLQELKSSE